MHVECVFEARAKLGEGVSWSPDEQAVWFVDILSDRIYRFDPASGEHRVWQTPPRPGFIVPRKSGGFIVGLRDGLHDFDADAGVFPLRLRVDAEHPGNRLNDGFVDPVGRLWFGTMDDDGKEATGSLYRYDKGGLAPMDSGYRITNGPAISPDGRTLYHADTLAPCIYAFDLADDGSISGKRLFATLGRGYADGMAVDAEGHLWNAVYGGWGMDRYSPDGRLVDHVTFPCANVTKLAFAGDDLRTVYATTATAGLSKTEMADQPLAGGLFRFTADVAGLPGSRFDE